MGLQIAAEDFPSSGLIQRLSPGTDQIRYGPRVSNAIEMPSETLIPANSANANTGASPRATGPSNAVNGARLNMQLSAEHAAGVRAPTTIKSYSDHAIIQINSRDSGIGVSQIAIDDAFANPVSIRYMPSK